ncbi:hypothetical protein ACFQ12_27845 [Methylobacterium trifolii]
MTAVPDMTHATFVPGNGDFMMDPGSQHEMQLHPDFRIPVAAVRFDAATGEIVEALSLARAHILREKISPLRSGVGITFGAGHYRTHYVDLSDLSVRPKTPCPATLAGMVLESLPVPCRIEIDNLPAEPGLPAVPTVYSWSEPALTLAFDHAAIWTVRVLSVPHLPGVFTVTTDA